MSKPDREGRSDRHRFRDTALASGLLEEAQIAAAERDVGMVMSQRSSPPEDWDRAIAEKLVAQGLLTPFQSREMLAGRRRFRLGQYTVLDEVGKGGMGRVFRAEHAMMGREVAVKVLPREKATPESEAAFRREMRMLGRLDHENLVRAFDAGFDAQVYYLVTELVPGVDLKRYVKDHGPLDETAAARVIAQAARGLAYAHEQGLVHRDVKPGNLLVMQDMRVKVLDLGLAGSDLEEESSRVGRIIGTMDYIAPEQIRAPDDVGPSADVYALGCTLYFAVTGQVPFPGGNRKEKLQRHLSEMPRPVKQLAPGLSDAFCRVVEEMMAKSQADRIGSANAVIERLRPWLVEGRDRAERDAIRPGGPPPLPGEAIIAPWPGEQTPPLERPQPVADDWPTVSSLLAAAGGALRTPALRNMVRPACQAAVIAAPTGLVFGLAMALVRGIDKDRFTDLLRGATPGFLGFAAFVAVFLLQMVAVSASRRSS
jgi:serine/threonine-protein kinase